MKKLGWLGATLILCPALSISQVPSDQELGALRQAHPTLRIPSAAELGGVGAAVPMMPSDEDIARQQRGFETAIDTAFKNERLKTFEPPVSSMGTSRAEQREAYREQVGQGTAAMRHDQNLNEILNRYQAEQERALRRIDANAPLVPQDALLVFVSFSMPERALEALASQARAAGATLVLRGFKEDSLGATKRAALAVNRSGAPWEINPQLFKTFGVASVPTFVLTGNREVLDNGCPPEKDGACSLSSSFAQVSGDLSIELALDTIRRRASVPYVQELATARLRALAARRK